ncbi:MAG: GMC family oxidoreductase [Gemmatimonadaceae bacterium]|jgi:quinoprotein glucose dehydrogenase|nr:GMC family oxidoreductase [Gemmatimonadaceae bacterium]
MRTIETDVCVIGSGITAAMVAARLAEDAPASRVVVLEAGGWSTAPDERPKARDRWLAYGENPWHRDHLDDQNALGTTWGYSPNLHVGGLAMHWGGVAPRYSPEDFRLRSLYGVGDDWPIAYDDLEPFYLDAERRLGVAGERGPARWDARTSDYPLPALPINWNLAQLREAAAEAGVATWSTPSAKNSVPYQGRAQCQRCDTCYPICPTGAKYTPDVTWQALLDAGRIRLETQHLVRRLEPHPTTDRIVAATGNRTDAGGEPFRVEAGTFVLAAGFVWSAHLLLLSRSARHPEGLANRSGLVGKYLAGHRNIGGYLALPGTMVPGINQQHSLVSHQFMRAPAGGGRYLRHDLRLWESAEGREPRGRDESGAPLYGDRLLADWRRRATGATARIRAYYDVLPHRESRLVLDATRTNRFGDPMPHVEFRDAESSAAARGWQEDQLRARFTAIARAAGGRVLKLQNSANDLGQEHPAGGCRMGTDPARSVCDPTGRTHEHENLWIAGAPAHVSAGCCNGTLTFAAMGLRTAAHIAGTAARAATAQPTAS